MNIRKGQIMPYRVEGEEKKKKKDTKHDASMISLIKNPQRKMFKIVEEVFHSVFSQLNNIFIESNFNIICMKIGRNWALLLLIKYSHKNCLYFHAVKARVPWDSQGQLQLIKDQIKKHHIYFTSTRVHSSIF